MEKSGKGALLHSKEKGVEWRGKLKMKAPGRQ